jgi:hypothetical protein
MNYFKYIILSFFLGSVLRLLDILYLALLSFLHHQSTFVFLFFVLHTIILFLQMVCKTRHFMLTRLVSYIYHYRFFVFFCWLLVISLSYLSVQLRIYFKNIFVLSIHIHIKTKKYRRNCQPQLLFSFI